MKEFPDVVLWAIPGFIACLIFEVAWGRRHAGVRYRGVDAAASLTMGIGSVIINGASAGLIAGAF